MAAFIVLQPARIKENIKIISFMLSPVCLVPSIGLAVPKGTSCGYYIA
jgi:hypothetical protein